jgi:type IV pilus assembly protein PilQ
VTNVLRLIGEVSNLNVIWGPEVSGKVSMRLKNVPWEQALDLILANNDLGKREEGNIIWVAPKSRIRQLEEEEKRKREEAIAEQERLRKLREEKEKQVELQTAYLPLDFASITDIKGHIEGILTERGKVSIDTRTNTLILQAIPENIEKAKKIVERFDTPVKQIMIEARIVDATTDFSRNLGIEWTNNTNAQRRTDTSINFGLPTDATGYTTGADGLFGGSFSSPSPAGWVPNLGFSMGYLTSSLLGSITLDANLALAEEEEKLRIISAPKVIASNGEEALISRGDIIYRDVVTADRIDTKELEAVLSLTVTPTVSFNDYVTMDVEVTDDQAPTDERKLEKKITTKLIVRRGETIVIGGIYKEEKTDNEAGIPWLKDIPLMGYLFKAEGKSLTRTELLIFITPTVVQTPGRLPKKESKTI